LDKGTKSIALSRDKANTCKTNLFFKWKRRIQLILKENLNKQKVPPNIMSGILSTNQKMVILNKRKQTPNSGIMGVSDFIFYTSIFET